MTSEGCGWGLLGLGDANPLFRHVNPTDREIMYKTSRIDMPEKFEIVELRVEKVWDMAASKCFPAVRFVARCPADFVP
jgi:hypothetical protein